MSDTPRTDALESQMDGFSLGDAGSLFVELARELEREAAAQRVLHESDAYCPKCGHNRDKSSVSTIDMQDGTRQCQMCGTGWREIAATATPTPPPLSPPKTATVPAEPGSTPPERR